MSFFDIVPALSVCYIVWLQRNKRIFLTMWLGMKNLVEGKLEVSRWDFVLKGFKDVFSLLFG